MPITPEERYQILQQPGLSEDLELGPESTTPWYVNNILTRTLARILGWTGSRFLLLRCTSAGVLKTAPTASGIEWNDTKKGYASDTWSADLVFDSTVAKVDVWVWENDMEIQFKNPSGLWDDAIEIGAGMFFSFDRTTTAVRVRNKISGLNARYQIVGWW